MKIPNNFLRKPGRVTLSCFLIFLSTLTCAGEDDLTPQSLINLMSRATHELNYDGIFIYKRGRQMDVMRVLHKNGENGEVERLVSLNGYQREVIRNNKTVTCIFPDNKEVIVEKSHPQALLSAKLSAPVTNVSNNYYFSFASPDRIAGHDTYVVVINPKDNYRYGYRLWIDMDNHLLMKSELKNTTGFSLEEIIFTKLDVLAAIPDELLEPSLQEEGYTWYNSAALNTQDSEGITGWNVNWMPEGFTKTEHEFHPLATSLSPVDHFVFTDGMAMVSVFIEKIKQRSQILTGPSRIGAVNAFSRLAGGYQVTVVGEVPQVTVQKMAISVDSSQ